MGEFKKNDEFELNITDMSDDGSGIGKKDGFTWFVKDAVIGDTVKAAAMKVKKSYGYARLVEIIKASDKRTESSCPKARACGGCQIQQLTYAAQLEFKEKKVRNALKRIGGLDIDKTEPIISMEYPFRYRNKAIYPIGKDKNGRVIAGFFAGRTHSIIECTDCLLGYGENKDILTAVIDYMEDNGIEPYDELSGNGIMRNVMIRKGHTTGETMVCLIINARKLKNSKDLISRLIKVCPSIRSISLCINRSNTNVILDGSIETIYGKDYIEDVVGGIRFKISVRSFFQVNPIQMEKLYMTALEYAGLTGTENVWDLYCGVGTISLFMAKKAGHVMGVEVIPEAIENANENAKINGIKNISFYTGKAEEVLPQWKKESGAEKQVDVVVVDPPRKGCDIKCLETIVWAAPKKIVYVSCDPATLARDLKYLCGNGYTVERVRPCDMFPQTVHVEVVIQMTYCGDKAKMKE